PQTIENLGEVNIICLDKTGTITENKMTVAFIYDYESDQIIKANEIKGLELDVLLYGVLASEEKPFDAMEKAIEEAYKNIQPATPGLVMIKEYPLEGYPPMMTHVYKEGDKSIATAKGGVERILRICNLSIE